MAVSIADIANNIDAAVEGDPDIHIERLSPIETAAPGTITFLSNARYERYLPETGASAIIVSKAQHVERKDIVLLRVDDPYLAFLKTLTLLHGHGESHEPGIHPSAAIDASATVHASASIAANVTIGEDAVVGAGTWIGDGSVIGKGVKVGERCLIYPNVTIVAEASVGDSVIIHAGTTIGSDGFGFVPSEDTYHKIPQIGSIIIENDVEIGANCAIDRGTIGNTVVGAGAKLDNLIQIAHNVEIGPNTVVAAQSGISGSTSIGKNVVIAGQVGIVGHIEIGDRVTITAQSGVSKSMRGEGKIFRGSPAREIHDELRLEAAIRQLPELIELVRTLEKRIEDLQDSPAGSTSS